MAEEPQVQDQDNLSKLHANLVKDGYELPPLDSFKKDMSDPVKLQKLHTNLKNEGYDLPDINKFSADLGYGEKKNPVGSQSSKTTSQLPYQNIVNNLPKYGGLQLSRNDNTTEVQPHISQEVEKIKATLPARKKEAVKNVTLATLAQQGKAPLEGSKDYNELAPIVEHNLRDEDYIPSAILPQHKAEIKRAAIGDFAWANKEKEEDVQKKIDNGTYLYENGKVKEKGGFGDNFWQGVVDFRDNVGLAMNISAAQEKGNNNEIKYHLNQFNEKKKYDREFGADDIAGKSGKLIGGLVPYVAGGAIMPFADVPMMGFSNMGAMQQEIWNDNKLTEDEKIKAINNTSTDAFMTGALQGIAFHGFGEGGLMKNPTASKLLSDYAPTAALKKTFAQKVYNGFGDLLKTTPQDVTKAAAIGGGTEVLNNLTKNSAGIKVDFSSVPQAALEMGTLDLLMKTPKVLTTAFSTLNSAKSTGYDKINPEWYNKYSKETQDALNNIVAAPKPVYDEALSQLDKSPDPAAAKAKAKIEEFRGYYNDLPSDLPKEVKDKALHIIQLKSEAQEQSDKVTEPGIKSHYAKRASAYDKLLDQLLTDSNVDEKSEPLLTKRFADPGVPALQHEELSNKQKEGIEVPKEYGEATVDEKGEGENKTYVPKAVYFEKDGANITLSKPIKIETEEGKTYTDKDKAQKAADEALGKHYYENGLAEHEKPLAKEIKSTIESPTLDVSFKKDVVDEANSMKQAEDAKAQQILRDKTNDENNQRIKNETEIQQQPEDQQPKVEEVNQNQQPTEKEQKQQAVNDLIDRAQNFQNMRKNEVGRVKELNDIKNKAAKLGLEYRDTTGKIHNKNGKVVQKVELIKNSTPFHGYDRNNYLPETNHAVDVLTAHDDAIAGLEILGRDGKRLSEKQRVDALQSIRDGKPTHAGKAIIDHIDKAVNEGGISIEDVTTGKRVKIPLTDYMDAFKEPVKEMTDAEYDEINKHLENDSFEHHLDNLIKQIEHENANAENSTPNAGTTKTGTEGTDGKENTTGSDSQEPDDTSIKNEITRLRREQLGLKGEEDTLERDFGTVWDEAKQKIADGYNVQDLIDELKKKARPISDLEDALLLHQQNTKEIELLNTNEQLSKAYEDGKDGLAEEAKVRRARLLDELQDIYDVNKAAGRETARGLSARRMMVDRKYNLVNMKMDARAANDGKPLTADQEAEVEKLHQKIKDTQKAYDDYVKEAESEIKALQEKILSKKVVNKKSAATKLREYADNLEKASKGKTFVSIVPITPKMVADAMRLIAAGLEKGEDVIELIKKAIDEIKKLSPEVDEKKLEKEINKSVIDSGIIGASKDNKDLKDLSEIIFNRKSIKLKADAERAKSDFDFKIKEEEAKARTTSQKVGDTFIKWQRAFKLSNPVTMGKLAAAAITRGITDPLEEGVYNVISPLLPKSLKEGAYLEGGGVNIKETAEAYKTGILEGMKDAYAIMSKGKHGKSDIDVLFGKGTHLPPEAIDFFGQLHSATKAPIKRAIFEKSLLKGLRRRIKAGVDVSDPMVQSEIAIDAYKKANRAIFMQDNKVADGWQKMVNYFDKVDPKTGKANSKTASVALQWLVPFVKVPTNIASEIGTNIYGVPVGIAKIVHGIFDKGLENLTTDEKEIIVRNLKKGTLGAAALTLGYMNPQIFGGYYQDKEKRRPDDAKANSVKIFGMNIPAWLIESPIFQAMQVGATVRRVKDTMVKGETKGIGEGAIAGMLGLAEHVPMIDQPMRILGAIKSPTERDWYVDELAKSTLEPSLLQKIAEWTDPEDKRKPTNLGEHLEMGILGLRENVRGAIGITDKTSPAYSFLKDKGEGIVAYKKESLKPVDDRGRDISVTDEKYKQFIDKREQYVKEDIQRLLDGKAYIEDKNGKMTKISAEMAKKIDPDMLKSYLMSSTTEADNKAIEKIFKGEQKQKDQKSKIVK